MNTGLVSVSFRPLLPEQIVSAAKNAGLKWIEWGSDVHAPYDDAERIGQIVELQKTNAIGCCSYGTYFRLGIDDLIFLPSYIETAKRLGTNILRLWCGKKSPAACSEEERVLLFEQCKAAAEIAENFDVILCLECHRNTYTETKEGALELMEAVNSSAFRMYWQPNQNRSIEENLEYAKLLKEYIGHIHVFQWKGKERFPLAEGIEEWKKYIQVLGCDRTFLLEFMPDDMVESLPKEAAALFSMIGEEK